MDKTRPYKIRRLALQLEMDDGTIMTVYADEQNADGAEVTITTEAEVTTAAGFWDRAAPVMRTQVEINIEKLNGYVMTIRDPADAPQWIQEARKGIEQ